MWIFNTVHFFFVKNWDVFKFMCSCVPNLEMSERGKAWLALFGHRNGVAQGAGFIFGR